MKKTDESKSKIGTFRIRLFTSSIVLLLIRRAFCIVGRFGIGFNSVYHITELPSFVSASNVVLLDPQVQRVQSNVATPPAASRTHTD